MPSKKAEGLPEEPAPFRVSGPHSLFQERGVAGNDAICPEKSASGIPMGPQLLPATPSLASPPRCRGLGQQTGRCGSTTASTQTHTGTRVLAEPSYNNKSRFRGQWKRGPKSGKFRASATGYRARNRNPPTGPIALHPAWAVAASAPPHEAAPPRETAQAHVRLKKQRLDA